MDEGRGAEAPSGYGHVEFLYDFREGGEANGWLHALGRFEQKSSGHRAETIFGAHIYNTAVIYKDEPQSYTNKPPGLTTRLFLRIAGPALEDGSLDTLCHLIYPASSDWHPKSSTLLILHDADGKPVAERKVEIACGGSFHWRLSEMFGAEERERMGGTGYVIEYAGDLPPLRLPRARERRQELLPRSHVRVLSSQSRSSVMLSGSNAAASFSNSAV